MHADELDVSPELARRLLRAQHPSLSGESIERVPSWGTVNAMFRVGSDAVMRMPLTPGAGHPEVEADILDALAGRLPARIPAVLERGEPGEGYPRRWLLLDWIDGVPPEVGTGGVQLADDLAELLAALHTVPVDGAPIPFRGGPLAPLDGAVRRCLRSIAQLVDARAAYAVWRDALAAAPWHRDGVWVHGDLLAGNVLLGRDARLAAIIDWEAAGVGDPACDYLAAWSVLDEAGRMRLREATGVDDDTWRRGRGWALSQAAIALPYYRETNRRMADHSRHLIAALVASA
jgi:aminoglycoside phosphotransferase (APT) family kinase protein